MIANDEDAAEHERGVRERMEQEAVERTEARLAWRRRQKGLDTEAWDDDDEDDSDVEVEYVP